jgi:hypothetical protein
MATARDCALGAAILGGQADYHAIGGPWWAEFALAVFALLITCFLMCLRIVFPQDSPDRLTLWLRLRPRRRRRRGGGGGGT